MELRPAMSNGVSHQVVIVCEAEGYPVQGQTCGAQLEIEFGVAGPDHVEVCTRLRIVGQVYGGWRRHYGCDILAFTEGLVRIHSGPGHSAWLVDWDGEDVLCATVVDDRRGRIAIGGQLIPAVFRNQTASE